MNWFDKSAFYVVKASGENPALSVLVVMLFYVMFVFIEASVERLIFGERFENFLDPVFAIVFMGYAAYVVYMCALVNMATD